MGRLPASSYAARMTLVAGISVGGLPAFVGDLLTSWRVPAPADLPTRPTLESQPGQDGAFAGALAQKLIIVRSYFMLAWMGSKPNADRILAGLDRILPDTVDDIADFDPIFSLLASCEEESELIALVIGHGMIQPYPVRTRGYELDGKRIYQMGSGGPAFFKFLTAHPNMVPDEPDADGIMARAIALRFAARAFATQWITGGGLEESWGGGFEVVYPEPDGFRKIDRVLFRAWQIDGDGHYINSGRSFFSRYHGGDLYLSAFNPEERTFRIPSPVGEPAAPPGYEVVRAAWTVDMFVHAPTGSFIEFARFQPDHRPVNDVIELVHGEIKGWAMDQAYVETCVETAIANAGKGDALRFDRY